MTTKPRSNRKVSDEDLIKFNSVGLSLGRIGEILSVHPTTITMRLRKMGICPADTRRSFMEDIYNELSEDQRDWLFEQVGPHMSVKDYVKGLMTQHFFRSSKRGQSDA